MFLAALLVRLATKIVLLLHIFVDRDAAVVFKSWAFKLKT